MNMRALKANTSAEYTRRINNALEFIHHNIDQAIRLDDVAKASHFSPYHFHRIFHALVGETVNDYAFRKRMEKAACRLIYKPELSVTAVAGAGGFSSSANFAKAFKLYFAVSPSELRNSSVRNNKSQHPDSNVVYHLAGDLADKKNGKIGKLYRKYGKVFNPQKLYSQFVTHDFVFDPDKLEEMLMKVKVEEQQEKRIAYLTTPRGYELDSVYATWDKIIHWANGIGIKDGSQTRFAICHDNPLITPENKCRYDAAIVVGSDVGIAPPYYQSVIPAGKYAVAYYKDGAEKISNFMTELCSHWFPSSGYEPDDYPPIFNYLNDSRQDGYVEMDVYIKIKKLRVD